MNYSIVTVTFNDFEGLRRTVDSIIGQTNNDYEVIVIDGASTCQQSIDFIMSLKGVERFRVISEPDRGIYDAMNKGLRHVRGKYFIFMNSGDAFHSSHVLDNVAPYIADEVPLFFGQARICSSQVKEGKLYPKNGINIDRWLSHSLPSHQAMFFRSDLFKDHKFNEDLKVSADSVFKLFALEHRWRYREIVICDFYLGGLSSSNSIRSIYYQFKDRLKRSDRFGGLRNALFFLFKKSVKYLLRL